MKASLLLTGIVVILFLPRINAEGWYFSIVGPRAFRPGVAYNVTATTYNTTSDVNLTLSILGSNTTVLASKRATIKSGEANILFLPIPEHVPYNLSYELVVGGLDQLNVTRYGLQVKRKSLSLFVQTDKAVYKPGQTVLFRVIAVHPDLKPYPGPLDIFVYDPFSNRIFQKLSQQNDTGVTTHSLALADQTTLGNWTINVTALGNTFIKSFQVQEYVLPKFEVNVILPSLYLVNLNRPDQQADLLVTVTAKYTYGEAVKGRSNITIQLKPYFRDDSNYTRRIIDVELTNGKADISLTIQELEALVDKDSTDPRQFLSRREILFVANVTETVTGVVISANSTVRCTSLKYSLKFLDITPSFYKPGLTFWAFLQLSRVDDSAPDAADITAVGGGYKTISVVVTKYYWGSHLANATTEYINITIDPSGIMNCSIEIPSNVSSCTLKGIFEEIITNSSIDAQKNISAFMTRDKQVIQVTYDSPEPVIKSSQAAKFIVVTSLKITTFQYAVMSKGSILLSDIVVGESSTQHRFSFLVTKTFATELAPRARIVVWFLTSLGEIVADSAELPVKEVFANEVSLSFDKNETTPAKNVTLTVTAGSGSSVYLLAVDQSVLLLKGGNDITQDLVSQDLKGYDTSRYNSEVPCKQFYCWWPIDGQYTDDVLTNSGLFIITNAAVSKTAVITTFTTDGEFSPTLDTSRPRVFFPETWMWTDYNTGPDGKANITAAVPDTITSWIASAFALNNDAGLGVAANTAKLTVFKQFFVSPVLPYSIRRGEEFALRVSIFNYLSATLQIQVTLQPSSYFGVLGSNSKTAKVAGNDATSVAFWIIARALGQIPITISAVSPVAGDTVTVVLLVKPEGLQQQYSNAIFIQLVSSATTYSSSFDVSLPPAGVLVEGSVYLEVICIGDILVLSIKGLNKLLKMPSGCGEQNMLNFAPDLYILLYLDISGQLTPDILNTTLSYLLSGYQRQLTYQRSDGSFSAFGDKDASGSMWLSAFVIKCFRQAKDYIPVEDGKIAQTLKWIWIRQAANGSFAEPPNGGIYHVDMQGGSAKGLPLSAYVLIALLQNRNNSENISMELTTGINLAQKYLEEQVDKVAADPYALSICAYALVQAGSPKVGDVLRMLDHLVINENDTKHWEKSGDTSSPESWQPHVPAKAINIEMTSYILLTYCRLNNMAMALPIAKWIIAQRNPDGGFSSTQDTVMALEALTAFAALMIGFNNNANLQISIVADMTEHSFLPITRENLLLLQSFQIPSNTSKVFVTATGTGSAVVQFNAKFNVYETAKEDNSGINVTVSVTQIDVKINVEVCSSWTRTIESGMVMMEFYLLTGYKATNVDQLQHQSRNIKRVEVEENKINIYFDQLTSEPTCINIILEKVNPACNVKDAPIKVYPYYDPSGGRTVFYALPEGLAGNTACDECPDCCDENVSRITTAVPVTSITTSVTKKPSCPCGFTYLPQVGKCYKLVYANLDWTSAGQICQQFHPDAHLVVINSKNESDALKIFLESDIQAHPNNSNCWRERYGKLIWISLRRTSDNCDASFVWKMPNSVQLPLTYTDWFGGQPDCAYNNEFCVQLLQNWQFLWNDASCDLQFCALCEYEVL